MNKADFTLQARISLLELLALRSPQQTLPIAAAWAKAQAEASGMDPALKRAGLNCRLVLDPGSAWPLIEAKLSRARYPRA
jgi:hypothetical protein